MGTDMSVDVILDLPYPPTVNHYYRHVGNRVLISREGREYRRTIYSILFRAGTTVHLGDLKIHIDVHPPDRRRRDLDNILKALLDALESGNLYRNDSQISELSLKRFDRVENGKIIVYLWNIE